MLTLLFGGRFGVIRRLGLLIFLGAIATVGRANLPALDDLKIKVPMLDAMVRALFINLCEGEFDDHTYLTTCGQISTIGAWALRQWGYDARAHIILSPQRVTEGDSTKEEYYYLWHVIIRCKCKESKGTTKEYNIELKPNRRYAPSSWHADGYYWYDDEYKKHIIFDPKPENLPKKWVSRSYQEYYMNVLRNGVTESENAFARGHKDLCIEWLHGLDTTTKLAKGAVKHFGQFVNSLKPQNFESENIFVTRTRENDDDHDEFEFLSIEQVTAGSVLVPKMIRK